MLLHPSSLIAEELLQPSKPGHCCVVMILPRKATSGKAAKDHQYQIACGRIPAMGLQAHQAFNDIGIVRLIGAPCPKGLSKLGAMRECYAESRHG
ncbi:hypothetical protein FZEAL_4270 [Fusarium zealandicum]|uniref:Uncharacterized protein n=1 Tax=Fusarium zealandicum TaxID=1053134 RepID=A0A8H4UMW5_9HYPO|nr:hypothetical protein FZEAL_4270 [Fusarium zealandicum]